MEGPSRLVDVHDYLRVLRDRRAIVVLAALSVLVTSLVLSFLQTPVYEGKAEVLLRSRERKVFDSETAPASDPARTVQTEIRVLKSQPVREEVRARLGVAPKISANPIGQTDVIEVKSRTTDPESSAAVANAYAQAYLDFRRSQETDDAVAAENGIQNKVNDFQRQIDGTDPKATQRRDALVQQQGLFKQKLDQLQVDSAVERGGGQVITPAVAATSPIKPKPVRSAIVALPVGLLLGVAAAFAFEHLDDSIKAKDDLEQAAPGLATLGLIPAVAGWKEQDRPVLVSLSDPKAPAAEAYRALRTSIQFLGLDEPLRTIQVTSPMAGEGKTTTIANLGVALAKAGKRVVIVSCDLRRPRLHEYFAIRNGVGFTSVLLGDVPVSGAIRSVSGIENLKLVASGPVPPNPSELLAGRRTVEAFAALQREADVVLIDAPPVLPVTDAAVLANRVDGTLLVAAAGKTTRRELHRAHEVLRQVDARLIGAVLNGVAGDAAYGYSYGYEYAYEAGPPERNGRKGRHSAVKI